jgi:6,7-dimethyl-8-ribityllumazine synthase
MADVANSNLLNIDAGILDTEDACVVIVRTEWNAAVTEELERGCRRVLEQYGIPDIKTIVVPGAFEIPFAIRSYWGNAVLNDEMQVNNNGESEQQSMPIPDAFIALGCVIRGDTPHFDYVCKAVTDGVLQLNLSIVEVPVIFGVLTVDNQQQAEERTGGKHGHKGEEAAVTALKMIALQQSFEQ